MASDRRSTLQKIKRIVLWLLSPLALILVLVIIWFPLSKFNLLPPVLRTAAFKPLQRPEGRDARWQQDLDYYADQLPRLHKDLYHAVDQATWKAAVAELSADISSLTDEEIIIRFMELTAMIGDGHTTVGLHRLYNEPFNFRTYPIGLKWYPDGWYVFGGLPEYREMFGARVLAIDGTSIDEADDRVESVISYDNEMQLRSKAGMYLTIPEVLEGLGLISQADSVVLTVETLDGEEMDVTVSAENREALQDAVSVTEFFGEGNVPLALEREDEWYWYEYLPESEVVYFQYDRCGNMKDLRFRDFNEEMFQFIDDHDVETIIVDLRYNGGGNSLVLRPFLKALEERPDLDVTTLIGRQTFSSALMNAIQLDEAGATLIGEPTGGRPNHYGEVRPFRLPNSGLPIFYATRYFRELEDRDPASLEPDIAVDPTIEDQLAGRDAVLQRALATAN